MHDAAECWSLMRRIGTCLLVTATPGGLRGRPMEAVVADDAGAIWFLVEPGGALAAEIERAPDVGLGFSDGGLRHVWVAGHATLIDDRDAIDAIGARAPAARRWSDASRGGVNAIHVEPVDVMWWGNGRGRAGPGSVRP